MIEITLKAVPKLCVPGDGGGGMITTGAMVASLADVLVLLILLFHNIQHLSLYCNNFRGNWTKFKTFHYS